MGCYINRIAKEIINAVSLLQLPYLDTVVAKSMMAIFENRHLDVLFVLVFQCLQADAARIIPRRGGVVVTPFFLFLHQLHI